MLKLNYILKYVATTDNIGVVVNINFLAVIIVFKDGQSFLI